MNSLRKISFVLLLTVVLLTLTGCGSTRTENDVIIENKPSNPLKFW